MKGNPAVIQALQAMLALEAQLNIQYRHDWRIVKFKGVKKTARDLKRLGDRAHCFMKKLADRILMLGGETGYTVGEIRDQQPLAAIFQYALELEQRLAEMGIAAIRTAVENSDEATAEILRHVEERHEENTGWLEQQLGLIGMVGGEGEYIAEKL